MISNFNIGDIVEVVDNGKTYSGFERMAEEHNLNRWVLGMAPINGTIGKIIFCDTKKESHRILHGVATSKCDYIINNEGLKLVKRGMETNDF